MRLFKSAAAPLLLTALGGCKMVVMDPAGDIAVQQRDLILLSTVLMLLIIVPVIGMTLYFAWKYRASNTKATYDPEWHHSTRIEMVVWAIPMAIILVLGGVAWVTSHTLDPYRQLDRLGPNRPVPQGVKPLEVEVVALDWKWLFIYPDLGIATVNEMAAPVDRPIEFKITASSVMNSFYVPALAGQIYAMPGMQTQMHAVINHRGVYDGLSANYSGAGFSGMHFKFKGMSEPQFEQWVSSVRGAPGRLTHADYLALAQPSTDDPVRHFGGVDQGLFLDVVNRWAQTGKTCTHELPSTPGAHTAKDASPAMSMPMPVAAASERLSKTPLASPRSAG